MEALLVSTARLSELLFQEAGEDWLETRRYHLAPQTFKDYLGYIHNLAKFFGEMRLPEITGDMVRMYQHERRKSVSPQFINKELGVLIQMRKRVGMPLVDYQRLMVPKDYEAPGRALDEDEEQRLERVCRAAVDHESWDVAALCTLLSMFSGLAPCEILSLKLKHCDIDPAQVIVPLAGAKRKKRERMVRLNPKAGFALKKLIERAIQKCSAADPEHYLIPFRNHDHSYDPTKPARGWRSGLEHLLGIADIKCRRYDFRHHAVSKAMRNTKVTRQGIIDYFGWASPKMFNTYYHAEVKTLEIVAAAITKKSPRSVQISSLIKRLKNLA